MVAAAPNLTRLEGTITSREPHPTLGGWDRVRVAVSAVAPVPGQADLLTPRARQGEVDLAVRSALLGAAGAGWHIAVRAKLTQTGVVAEGYPREGDFRVSPPG